MTPRSHPLPRPTGARAVTSSRASCATRRDREDSSGHPRSRPVLPSRTVHRDTASPVAHHHDGGIVVASLGLQHVQVAARDRHPHPTGFEVGGLDRPVDRFRQPVASHAGIDKADISFTCSSSRSRCWRWTTRSLSPSASRTGRRHAACRRRRPILASSTVVSSPLIQTAVRVRSGCFRRRRHRGRSARPRSAEVVRRRRRTGPHDRRLRPPTPRTSGPHRRRRRWSRWRPVARAGRSRSSPRCEAARRRHCRPGPRPSTRIADEADDQRLDLRTPILPVSIAGPEDDRDRDHGGEDHDSSPRPRGCRPQLRSAAVMRSGVYSQPRPRSIPSNLGCCPRAARRSSIATT